MGLLVGMSELESAYESRGHYPRDGAKAVIVHSNDREMILQAITQLHDHVLETRELVQYLVSCENKRREAERVAAEPRVLNWYRDDYQIYREEGTNRELTKAEVALIHQKQRDRS